PQPAGGDSGGGAAGRDPRRGGTPAANGGPARCGGQRAAGDPLHRHPGQRDLLRPAARLPPAVAVGGRARAQVRGRQGGGVNEGLGLAGVLIAVLGGALRISTPFLFVSLGECLTEKSGRINLGLEGTLVMGAMTGYAIALHSGSPSLGGLCAGLAGAVVGALHSWLCRLQRGM